MNIVLVILLVLLFAYAVFLILANNSEVAVDLLATQVPTMNLGFLLIVSLVLGVLIGMLIALIVFKVLPMRFEINRLKKDKQLLQSKLDEATIVIEHHRNNQIISDTHEAVLQAHTPPNL